MNRPSCGYRQPTRGLVNRLTGRAVLVAGIGVALRCSSTAAWRAPPSTRVAGLWPGSASGPPTSHWHAASKQGGIYPTHTTRTAHTHTTHTHTQLPAKPLLMVGKPLGQEGGTLRNHASGPACPRAHLPPPHTTHGTAATHCLGGLGGARGRLISPPDKGSMGHRRLVGLIVWRSCSALILNACNLPPPATLFHFLHLFATATAALPLPPTRAYLLHLALPRCASRVGARRLHRPRWAGHEGQASHSHAACSVWRCISSVFTTTARTHTCTPPPPCRALPAPLYLRSISTSRCFLLYHGLAFMDYSFGGVAFFPRTGGAGRRAGGISAAWHLNARASSPTCHLSPSTHAAPTATARRLTAWALPLLRHRYPLLLRISWHSLKQDAARSITYHAGGTQDNAFASCCTYLPPCISSLQQHMPAASP